MKVIHYNFAVQDIIWSFAPKWMKGGGALKLLFLFLIVNT